MSVCVKDTVCHGNIFLSTAQNIMHKFEGIVANMLFEPLVCHQWYTENL